MNPLPKYLGDELEVLENQIRILLKCEEILRRELDNVDRRRMRPPDEGRPLSQT